MHESISKVKLQNTDLTIVKLEPPAGSYLPKIDKVWKRKENGFDAYVTKSLSGEMLAYTSDLYLFGEIDDKIVAWMGYITPVDTKDVGTYGFVHTQPEYRRKGISSALLQGILNEFEKRGGIALHLATNNPVAHHLYQKYGFHDLGTSKIMRYVRKGIKKFAEEYYVYNGKGAIRNVNWGDFPRLESLYSILNHPWLIRDYLRGIWQEERKSAYEYEVLHIMELEEKKKGAALVMENNAKRVVGCASLIVDEAITGKKSADFDLFVMPEYFGEISALLSGLEKKAKEIEIERLEIWIHPGDREKLEAIKSAGFIKTGEKIEARLSKKVEIPMELYGKQI
ncbi:MAG: Mycothiol acetyltransferase [candidate division WS2 bacterium]|nr:Mycothiol acetyltransferase [Candidatus Psychracetigena formicireducens]